MGILKKASEELANRFQRSGEESFGEVKNRPAREDQVEEPKAPKQTKAPRAKLGDLLPKRGAKEEVEPEEELSIPDELEDDEELPLAFKVATDTAFDLEDDEPFFGGAPQQTQWEDTSGLLSDPDEKPKRAKGKDEDDYDQNKINDVLEVLKIPATFVIPGDVLMPDDFSKIDFDLQVPQGYDIGQVEFFVERAESTVAEYLRLLENRNEHVAKLATTIDRLQVDLQNLKYDSQIAAGIGIMPTSDNDELERDNMELKLEVKRLKDKLKAKTETPNLSSKERELYENLRNAYSILSRERDDLANQVSDLNTKLAHMEEEADDPEWMAGSQTSSSPMPAIDFEGDDGGIEYLGDAPKAQAQQAPLEDDTELPDLDFGDFSKPAPKSDSSLPSSFELDEEQLPTPPAPQADSDEDDDDDELNKLMKGWS